MSEIQPALPVDVWESLARHSNHAGFAVITLEGGNDSEIGTPAHDDDYSNDAARASVQYAAAIAALNAALPDSDSRKITRADVADLFSHADGALWRRDMTLAATLSAIAAKLASYLPPEGT